MKPKKSTRKGIRRTQNAEEAAKARFQADLIERGEAAEIGPDGKLPQKATHAIIKGPSGTTIKRGRFKYV